MTYWLYTLAVVVLITGGVLVARPIARHPRLWVPGYLLPLAVILVIVVPRRLPSLAARPQFAWLQHGYTEAFVFAVAGAVLFGVLLFKLKSRDQKIATAAFAVLALAYYSLLPVLLPALLSGYHRSRPAVVNDGICRQQTSWTCGPAAAVTALAHIGLEDTEAELAVAAGTHPLVGTHPERLAAALERRFVGVGLRCRVRQVDRIRDLAVPQGAITVVEFSTFVDHYVAVLDVSDTHIVLGDPGRGRLNWTHAEFADVWRGTTVELWTVPATGKGVSPTF